MGKRGPASSHPSGFGHTTSKGYHRVWVAAERRGRFVHDLVWEEHKGPIPAGFRVHHDNEDKQDNRIGNLRLVDALTHKRIHSGCELRGGVWWKPCGVCGEFKPVDRDHWYLSPEGWPLYGRCRPCHIQRTVDDKRKRKARLRALRRVEGTSDRG